MRQNIESISNCIIEFSNINKNHNDELGLHIDKLSKVCLKMRVIFCIGYTRDVTTRMC
jgi:hypothetical protein